MSTAHHSLMMAPTGPAWAFVPEAPFLVAYTGPGKGMLPCNEPLRLFPQGRAGSGAPYVLACLQGSSQGDSALENRALRTGPKPSLVVSSIRHLSVGQAGPQEAH